MSTKVIYVILIFFPSRPQLLSSTFFNLHLCLYQEVSLNFNECIWRPYFRLQTCNTFFLSTVTFTPSVSYRGNSTAWLVWCWFWIWSWLWAWSWLCPELPALRVSLDLSWLCLVGLDLSWPDLELALGLELPDLELFLGFGAGLIWSYSVWSWLWVRAGLIWLALVRSWLWIWSWLWV